MNQKKTKPRRQKHVPQRTCVICREKVDKRRLTRIVRTPDSGVVIDPTGKRNGRGAYLCDNPECWDKALQQEHLLNKALMTTVKEEEWAAIAAQKPVDVNHEQ
jgi:hypothetical protein